MKCRICGCEETALTLKAKEMMIPTRDVFEYFECANCHCLQIKEIPDDLGKYYGTSYYSFQTKEEQECQAPVSDRTPILDIGCGAGAFLKDLRRMGYGNLTGCDPFLEKDLSYGDAIRIYKKSVHEMEGQYKKIFLNDSFEHVTDPHEVLDSVYRLLAPEGIVRIAIPVYPNIAFDIFGEYWYQLDAPRHIYLHSRESMSLLAKEHHLTIIKEECDADFMQIYRSFLYSKDIPFWEQRLENIFDLLGEKEAVEIKKASDEANESGYGDHAVFYLVKSEEREKHWR